VDHRLVAQPDRRFAPTGGQQQATRRWTTAFSDLDDDVGTLWIDLAANGVQEPDIADTKIVDTLSDDKLKVMEGAGVKGLADSGAGLSEVGERRDLWPGVCETRQDASLRRGHEVKSLREAIAWA